MLVVLLCITGSAFALSYSDDNEYEVRKESVWAGFKDGAGEYPLRCRLDPGSLIHVVKKEGEFVYVTLLVSAAWDTLESTASLRGACRKHLSTDLRLLKKDVDAWEGGVLHYKK